MSTAQYLLNRQVQQVNESTSSKLTFSILQWNTLATCYTGQSHYPYLSKEVLAFNERSKLISQEIKSYNADVICLEEVDKNDLEFFKSLYSREEYSFSYIKKPHSKDGICIMIRKPFEVFDEEMIIHTKEETKEKQNLVSQVVVAKQKKDDLEVCLIVTACHLKAANFPLVRLHQARQLIEVIENKKQKCMDLGYAKENIFIVVCGDFNTNPESEPVQEFLQHKDFNLKSVFDDFEYTLFQTYGDNVWTSKEVVDFVMHSDSLNVTKRSGPQDSSKVGEKGLLSSEFPSDHLSLFCELSLCEAVENNSTISTVESQEGSVEIKIVKGSFCSVF